MTRLELLKIVIGKARANGFEFRRWYTARVGLPWKSADNALETIEQHRHYYALLFSHEFAVAFWKPGSEITFQVPARTFQRRMPDGSIQTIERKPFTRRSARKDAWRYHLRQMALAEDPLRYIRRYLNVEEDVIDAPATEENSTHRPADRGIKSSRPRSTARPLPTEPPHFLRRPYP